MKTAATYAMSGAVALMAILGFGHEANAVIITDGGTAQVHASGERDSIVFSVEGDVTFGVDDISDPNTLTLDFSLTNTSDDDPDFANDNRMTTFAFDVGGIVITAVSDNNGDWTAVVEGPGNNFPAFDVDICVFDGNNCAGGSNEGLQVGETLNIIITLTGPQTPPLTFDAFYARFQSTGADREGSDTIQGGIKVTEPATLALLGIGLLGAGVMARRRRLEA